MLNCCVLGCLCDDGLHELVYFGVKDFVECLAVNCLMNFFFYNLYCRMNLWSSFFNFKNDRLAIDWERRQENEKIMVYIYLFTIINVYLCSRKDKRINIIKWTKLFFKKKPKWTNIRNIGFFVTETNLFYFNKVSSILKEESNIRHCV
jgi:hypothetical protein